MRLVIGWLLVVAMTFIMVIGLPLMAYDLVDGGMIAWQCWHFGTVCVTGGIVWLLMLVSVIRATMKRRQV